MKQLAFNLMTYSGLPEDFAERFDGGWVDPKMETFDHQVAAADMNKAIDLLVFADELGFDAVCVNEHHQNSYGLMTSPQMVATALARETKQAAILILGTSIAGYNPPHRIAEDLATIDLMSGGRLIAGFPVGTPFDMAYALGQNPSSIRAKHREAEEMILRCWQSDDLFPYNGEHHQQAFIRPFLKPVQDPPTVWVPGGGAIETWRHAAEMDRNYSYTSYFGYEDAKVATEGYWEMVDECGLDRNPFRLSFLQFVVVADSKQEAMDLYREPAEYFFQRNHRVNPRWLMPPGYMTEATLRHKLRTKKRREMMANMSKTFDSSLTMENLVGKGYVVAGSPDEVAAEMREAMIGVNAGNLMLLLSFGDMSEELSRYNYERYAKEVMPQLADLWEDEWENPYWVKPTGSQAPAGTTAEVVR
jgi:alkanesulfonate monooxygenase SsuD/methylene tetrahydromethanopterin reductase-like flavin-dependent oxidoreductase (luciferase family)